MKGWLASTALEQVSLERMVNYSPQRVSAEGCRGLSIFNAFCVFSASLRR